MSVNDTHIIKKIISDGIGVDLSAYPPDRIAKDMSDFFNENNYKCKINGTFLELERDNSHISNIIFDNSGVYFSASNYVEMKEPIQILVKKLVQVTFN